VPTNPLDRRLAKLGDEWERRLASYEQKLFQPAPPFSVKMSEPDAFRKYLDIEAKGELLSMRESQGGFRPDKDVDAYARWGERMKAKYMPAQYLNETVGRPLAASGQPWATLQEPGADAEDAGPAWPGPSEPAAPLP
jgi:hypothetical protein